MSKSNLKHVKNILIIISNFKTQWNIRLFAYLFFPKMCDDIKHYISYGDVTYIYDFINV